MAIKLKQYPYLTTSILKTLGVLRVLRGQSFSLGVLRVLRGQSLSVLRVLRGQLFPLVFFVSFVGSFSCSNPSSPRSRPSATVSGRVSSSALWQSGTDVLVSGRVQVDQGVTLTIQSDVIIG